MTTKISDLKSHTDEQAAHLQTLADQPHAWRVPNGAMAGVTYTAAEDKAMRLSLTWRSALRWDDSFVEVAFDTRSMSQQWRPHGEAGSARWGKYAGCRWLGLMFLAQWKVRA